MTSELRYLLLQVRKPEDPMRGHEVECFARELPCDERRLRATDLLLGRPTRAELDAVDVVLLGGSGDYSVAEGGPWLDSAMDAMRELHELAKPTFASCWGFQAMARAMGGEVVRDRARAEVGTVQLHLTEAGREDPVFSPLESPFFAQIGHEDIVESLPPGASCLAGSDLVVNEAFTFPGRPIYCTQFHPELSLEGLLVRLRRYPRYVEDIAGLTYDELVARCRESPETSELLRRFLALVFA